MVITEKWPFLILDPDQAMPPNLSTSLLMLFIIYCTKVHTNGCKTENTANTFQSQCLPSSLFFFKGNGGVNVSLLFTNFE